MKKENMLKVLQLISSLFQRGEINKDEKNELVKNINNDEKFVKIVSSLAQRNSECLELIVQ